MPFYEYRCVKGHTFEVTQRMSDEPLTECQVCGAEASRVLFAPAIHFKGTGFHNTDYGTKRRPAGEDGGGSSGGDGASNGGGDAKPASTTTSDSSTSGSSSGSGSKTVGLDKV